MSTTPNRRTTADITTPAANLAATITYAAAGAGRAHVLHQLDASYSAAPTGGRLTVQNGATTIFDVDINAAGPQRFVFDPPILGSANSALTITLAAGGTGISGKLNAGRTQTSA